MTRHKTIPVVDLFAGPGGLGEGFSAFSPSRSSEVFGDKAIDVDQCFSPFQICLSIEKDRAAHQTLRLRSLYRNLLQNRSRIPSEYYDYVLKPLEVRDFHRFWSSSKYKDEAIAANEEALNAELGGEKWPPQRIDEHIRKALDEQKEFILIGGPPCQAYSSVGRSRMKNADPEKFENDHRHFLYKEYLRIIQKFQPVIFVMENVKGLLSSKIKGKRIFEEIILPDLKEPGRVSRSGGICHNGLSYQVCSVSTSTGTLFDDNDTHPGDYIVECENYGIPQARHRIILLGIRSDVRISADILKNLPLRRRKPVAIEDVIRDLPKIRSMLSREEDSFEKWQQAVLSLKNAHTMKYLKDQSAALYAAIIQNLKSFPSKLKLGGELCANNLRGRRPKPMYSTWYWDHALFSRCKGVLNHSSRGHIKKDLWRYFFSACFAEVDARSPKISDFPNALLPNHDNMDVARRGKIFNDRFRVQLKGRPSTTITSHISKDGHYYIHYDPLQCRSLSVREAARLQTFPDNYFFEGSRTAQYHQVGNAVPPLLALQIAEKVHSILKVANIT